ncbi:hypothetical protein A4X13_0g2373 [Tilletia indica]|uniref:Uncharacterized protein n=1 Tax=Tilletia indica TaxID=43049 RepID=A0A177TIR3_9BASI|nr:hypothetical protein A4X13_0g2373 [Tilletia indica]
MSSLGNLEQLEYMLYGSDDGGDDWTDDGNDDDESLEEDSESDDCEIEEDEDGDDQEEDDYDAADSMIDDNGFDNDSESVTSDPDVPVKIPFPGLPEPAIAMLRISEPVKQLLRDLAAMFDTSSEPLRDGVDYAQVILQMGTKGKFLKQGKETYIKRALVFYKHIAKMEKESGRGDVPGTAASMILREVLHQIRVFHAFIQTNACHTLVKRSVQREMIRSEYFSLLNSLRSITSCTEKHLGLGNVGKLHHAALMPRWLERPGIITLGPIELNLNEHLRVSCLQASETEDDGVTGFPELQTHMHLEFFLRNLRLPKAVQSSLKRKYDQQDASPDQVDSTPSVELTASETTGFNVLEELTASRLAFRNADQLRSWKRRAANNFLRLHRLWESNTNRIRHSSASMVLVLVNLTATLYQTHLIESADYVCELLVATVREAYEDTPSEANRIRLCSALGAYAMIAMEADRDQEGYRAAENAIAHMKTLCRDDSSEHLLLMAALKLSYSNVLRKAADVGKGPDPETRLCLLRKGVRAAGQAIDLARSTLGKNSADPDASNMLAYALLAKAGLCKSLGGACKDLQLKHAKRRAEVEKTRAKMGGSDGRIPIAYSYIDSPYVLEKVADQTFGSLDDAGVALDECIGIYQELAKETPHSYDFPLAEAVNMAAEVYHSSITPKPELCVARFREAISMFEQLSDNFSGLFDGLIEEASFDLALRLRWENRFEEADHAFEEMVSKRPDDDNEAAVPIWRGGNVLGGVFYARAMMCIRTECYDQALVHAERSSRILRAHVHKLGQLAEPLAVRGFSKWIIDKNGEGAEAALGDLKQSLKEVTLHGVDYSNPQQLRTIQSSAYGFSLALGWMGGVQCALGQQEGARVNGEKAVSVMRSLLKSEKAIADAERLFEPVEYVLPHLLVLLAGTHLQAGRYDEAKEAVEESLQVREKGVESSEGEKSQRMRADGPTRKTALLLKAMMLEKDGLELEAKASRDEAEKIPFKGFLKVLGCSSASETTT